MKKHITAGIRWWSPTQLLICRSETYVWQSGRDAQFPQSMVVCDKNCSNLVLEEQNSRMLLPNFGLFQSRESPTRDLGSGLGQSTYTTKTNN
jgi:hypothetical protein